MKPKFSKGDRVKIVLKEPYTKKEILELGCHPKVNNKLATIENVELVEDGFSYGLLMDDELEGLPEHDIHFAYPSHEYVEREFNLVSI